MRLDMHRVQNHLQQFDFRSLFIEELGWLQPTGMSQGQLALDGTTFERRPIAQLGGVVVLEIQPPQSGEGKIPDAATRAAIQREITRTQHENLLIFTDRERTQCLWYWVKRENGKLYPREHFYSIGQSGDLLLSKIASMYVDISELDETGDLTVIQATSRLQQALDVQPVTRRFYEDFRLEHLRFLETIEGIDDENDRRWYASVILNRLMFVYFLQRKGFLDGGRLDYLREKLGESRKRGPNRFYTEFLAALFFEGFAKPREDRSPEAAALVGDIRYLNGGLFLTHPIETRWPDIAIPDHAFDDLLGLFSRYSWNLDDTPGGDDNEINPDVLGYIFEKYINQKSFGAYYTPPEITEYLCVQTIHRLILERINLPAIPGVAPARQFTSLPELLMSLDARLCRELLSDVLPKLSLLDPACGSGAFLVAAMKTLIDIYSAIIGKIQFLNDSGLNEWLRTAQTEHRSLNYYIKKKIITDNLFGVDIMEEAAEIARLRLFLALVSSVETVDQIEALPNIDFNILTGNSLIGLPRVDEGMFNTRYNQMSLLTRPYREVVAEKNRLLDTYRQTSSYHDDLRALRDNIQRHRDEANMNLNEMLLDEFKRLGIKFEQTSWDDAEKKAGRAKKRDLRITDIEALHPFHWGYEFDRVMNERGGFDAIITNPPWDVFQADEKEFFQEFAPEIQKKKIRIEDWKRQMANFMNDEEIRDAWISYVSRFPHVSGYFKNADQYENQRSAMNGKRIASKINLYSYFTEQCYNLLRDGGQCGIVIPSGIYTDLGTKQLRQLLFTQTRISAMFGFENRKAIFDNVHRSYKFVVLSFEKGGETTTFPAAFMRHDVAELERFPGQGGLPVSVELVRRLSPDSLSIMEFKDEIDVRIAEKMLRFPLLGEQIEGTWNIRLSQELNMTSDSHLFQTEPGPGRLPLYEGKMIHQFTHQWGEPRYWVDERQGRAAILGRRPDNGQRLDYQSYRLGFRDIASNTNERTMISTMIPPTFHGNKIPTVQAFGEDGHRMISDSEQVFLSAVWNSFVIDFMIRMKVTTTLNFFYVYQLPIPRLTERDAAFKPIVERAARLICTTSEFDDLAQEVGLSGHEDGVTDPEERARLRAELDGMIAHLYGLTEQEFTHVLTTFPLVDKSIKEAALDAYREMMPPEGDQEIITLIRQGESATLEFKESARWDNTPAKRGEKIIIKTVSGFLNSDGGTLLIGVADNGSVPGLEPDYATLSNHPDRDGYEQFLTQLLGNAFGYDKSPYIQITFHPVEGREVCRITVKPSPEPVWVKDGQAERFYHRVQNTTRDLAPSSVFSYWRNLRG